MRMISDFISVFLSLLYLFFLFLKFLFILNLNFIFALDSTPTDISLLLECSLRKL